jgi:hypothetical protein
LEHKREIIRFVVTSILIEVRDHQACRNLQATNRATPIRICGHCYSSGHGLFTR